MKAIDLPPFAPILIESTRAIGYSLEAAIADIIDNSIAADASNVHVRFFPVDEPYLAIIDDGCGMDDEEITQAMQYGSANPLEERSRKDLGRFGLGLKTASLSQCRQLTVVSKKGSHYVGRRWDIDFVNSTGKSDAFSFSLMPSASAIWAIIRFMRSRQTWSVSAKCSYNLPDRIRRVYRPGRCSSR